ncbi:MAG: hypothetical protein AB7H80_10270 [Candidatus Kapaibacterium sp.]
MSEKHIDDFIRGEYPHSLSLGFAERVASLAMNRPEHTVWDFFSRLSPRAAVALSAVAMVLFVFGVTGEGPDLLQSISDYASLTEFIPFQ